MPNIEKAFNELADVVCHLVTTHVRWNMDMTRDMAYAKIALARTHAVSGDVIQGSSDAVELVKDVQSGDVGAVVTDVQNVTSDAAHTVSDATGQGAQNG